MLQEAGETQVVLQVGQKLLQERLPKSFKQDVVLTMALAYVDLSRDAMALSPPDFIKSCEVLERSLKLLQVLLLIFLCSMIASSVTCLLNCLGFIFESNSFTFIAMIISTVPLGHGGS